MADLRAALTRGRCAAPAGPGRDEFLIALCLFALAMAWFSLTLSSGLELRDEGHLYSMSARVADGAVPHRDFVDIYGPGVFWATGLVLDLFDGQILAVRVFLALLKAGAVACTFLIGCHLASRPVALLGALLAIALWGRRVFTLNAPYASLFTVPILLVALLLFLRAERRASATGFAAAGLLAGGSVLFKQSVGIYALFGFGLAMLAGALVARDEGERGPLATWALFGLAAIAAVVPFLGHLTPTGYLLHLLPLHAFMACVAVGAWRRGGGGGLPGVLRSQLAPFAAGAAIPLIVTAALYAAWGALPDLIYDMFGFPMTVPGYAQPVELPGAASLGVALALLSAVFAAALALGGRAARAVPWCVAALALGAAVVFLGEVPPLAKLGAELDGVVLALLLGLALLAFGPELISRGPLPRDPRRSARIAVVFFSCGLVVQIYPRAGFNVWLLAAALAPLIVALIGRAIDLAGEDPRRRFAVGVLAAMLLAGWTAPVVSQVLRSARAPKRALELPRADGLVMLEGMYRARKMADLEALVAHLRAEHPAESPVLLLSNQAIIFYTSGHPPLYPEHEYYLSLVGWQMLPERDLAALDEDALIERLRERPDALVIRRDVDRVDQTPRHYRASLPRLASFIDSHYEERGRFGVYRVLAPAH